MIKIRFKNEDEFTQYKDVILEKKCFIFVTIFYN